MRLSVSYFSSSHRLKIFLTFSTGTSSSAEHSPVSCKTFSDFSSYLIPQTSTESSEWRRQKTYYTHNWMSGMFLSIQCFLLCIYCLYSLSSNLLPFMHVVFPPVLYFHFACGLSVHVPLVFTFITLGFWLQNCPLLRSSSVSML